MLSTSFQETPKLSLVLFLVSLSCCCQRVTVRIGWFYSSLKKGFLQFSFVLRTQPTLLGLFLQVKPSPFPFIISFKAEWSDTLFCTLVLVLWFFRDVTYCHPKACILVFVEFLIICPFLKSLSEHQSQWLQNTFYLADKGSNSLTCHDCVYNIK